MPLAGGDRRRRTHSLEQAAPVQTSCFLALRFESVPAFDWRARATAAFAIANEAARGRRGREHEAKVHDTQCNRPGRDPKRIENHLTSATGKLIYAARTLAYIPTPSQGARISVPQQAFLRDAMRRMNMTRDTFASRIGVTRRALDTWLLPDNSQESRAMPEIARVIRLEIGCMEKPAKSIRKA